MYKVARGDVFYHKLHLYTNQPTNTKTFCTSPSPDAWQKPLWVSHDTLQTHGSSCESSTGLRSGDFGGQDEASWSLTSSSTLSWLVYVAWLVKKQCTIAYCMLILCVGVCFRWTRIQETRPDWYMMTWERDSNKLHITNILLHESLLVFSIPFCLFCYYCAD